MAGCRMLSEEEIEQIKEMLPRQRDRTLFILGYRLGWRISQLLAIKIGHVYQFGKICHSINMERVHVKGKRDSHETVLHHEAKHEIEKLLAEYQSDLGILDPDMYLFKSRKGKNKAISRVQAHDILKSVVNDLHLMGKVATHSMKKTFAWKFYKRSGHDLRATQVALKHRFIETTIKYLDPDQKEVDKLILDL